MKRLTLKRLFTTAFALLFSVALFAQENTLLWKISGNGLTKDSYLFGTLHMACAEDFKMEDKVKEVAQKAEAIAFEIDMANPENMTKVQEFMKPNLEFFKDFDPAKKKVIDSIMTSYQIPPAIFDQVAPAAVISILSMRSFACSDFKTVKMMENEIRNLPAVNGKPIAELETVEFQFNLLNNLFSPEDFYNYLTIDGGLEASTKKLVQAYFSENLKEIENLTLKSGYLSEEEQAKFLDERNHTWMEKMPNMMKEKAYLFAVGAGHLVGKNGMIELLKKQGYKLTPILD